MTALLLALGAAFAGYGDPVDGVPSPVEREVHLWTNAVRVAPSAFANDYPCAFGGFEPSEQTAKVPLWWNAALGTAARLHSEDMAARGELTHNSSDGSNSIVRLSKIYNGNALGENIAEGYDADPFKVVVEGWMCSPGHRDKVMSADYLDLGVGVADRFWTQDYGGREADPTEHKARLGIHQPANPQGSADFLLAVHTGDGAPGDVVVVVNGTAHPLILDLGAPESGIYAGSVDVVDACTTYWFEVDGDSYPEDGAFGFGDCPWADAEAQWLARADIPALQADDDEKGCGCTSAPGGAHPGLLLLALFGPRRRR